MEILDIDLGNTRVKWRLVPYAVELDQQIPQASNIQGFYSNGQAGDALLTPEGIAQRLKSGVEQQRNRSNQIARIRVASVRSDDFDAQLARALENELGILAEFSRSTSQALAGAITIKNSYAKPQDMGVDRWCAIAALANRFAGQLCAVVDAGTAMTIDFINGEAQHLGGYILPGFEQQVKTLLAKTDRITAEDVLTLPDKDDQLISAANNTTDAVRAGVLINLAGAIHHACSQVSDQAVPLLIGGGDALLLSKLLRDDTKCSPVCTSDSLVFDGLCYLLP